jgi:hypothetical protein
MEQYEMINTELSEQELSEQDLSAVSAGFSWKSFGKGLGTAAKGVGRFGRDGLAFYGASVLISGFIPQPTAPAPAPAPAPTGQ